MAQIMYWWRHDDVTGSKTIFLSDQKIFSLDYIQNGENC